MFQFQSGAIKGDMKLNTSSNTSLFQFQSGAIKGRPARLPGRGILRRFNSNLVQLKAPSCRLRAN